MKINKAPILLIILISLSSISYGQSDLEMFDIQTEAVLEFDMGWPGAGWQTANFIVLNGSFDLQYNITNQETKRFDMYTEIAAIYGRYDDSMIIMRRSKDKNLDFQLYIHNPENSDYKKLDGVPFFLNEEERLNKIYYYKENEYIVTYGVHDGDPVYYNTYLINADTGENTLLMKFDKVKVYDISPDKMHIIIASYRKKYISIYDIQEKRVISKIDFSGNPNYESSFYFLNSEYVFILERENGVIYNLGLEKEITLNYLRPIDVPNIGESLNKIMNSTYGRYTQEGGKRILVQMPGEQEIFEQNDLLFKPTTATANDSRVRIREWPLLDAKHLGYLTTGDKLEILDRSGIKVKIGDMEDYWYKIRRLSDGMEGWSYGKFIDIEGE